MRPNRPGARGCPQIPPDPAQGPYRPSWLDFSPGTGPKCAPKLADRAISTFPGLRHSLVSPKSAVLRDHRPMSRRTPRRSGPAAFQELPPGSNQMARSTRTRRSGLIQNTRPRIITYVTSREGGPFRCRPGVSLPADSHRCALQRLTKQRQRYQDLRCSLKRRLLDLIRWACPKLERALPGLLTERSLAVLHDFFDPASVLAVRRDQLRRFVATHASCNHPTVVPVVGQRIDALRASTCDTQALHPHGPRCSVLAPHGRQGASPQAGPVRCIGKNRGQAGMVL